MHAMTSLDRLAAIALVHTRSIRLLEKPGFVFERPISLPGQTGALRLHALRWPY